MTPEETKNSLEALTAAVCKTLNQVPAHGDKKFARTVKELELVNDAAMRDGLGLPVHRIAQLKMRSRGANAKSKPSEPRVLTPFQQLMDFHAKHIVGPLPDGAAQGSAVKWILTSFTPELAIKRYEAQLTESWRKGHVSWLTVKQDIGRLGRNGSRDATERNESRLEGSFQLLSELRGEDPGDPDQGEYGSSRTH
jgi:hypothetical protein